MADEGEPAQNEEAQNEDVQEQPPPQEEPPMEQAPQEAKAPAEGEPPQESEPPAMEPPQEGEPPAEKAEQEGEPPAAEASQEGETATTEGQQEGESLAAESKQEGEPPESLAEGAAPDAETDLEFNLEGDVIETSEVEEVKSSDLFNASVDVTGEEGPVELGEESPSGVVEEESIGGADSLQAEETELVNTDFKIKQETDTITLQSFPVIPDEVPPLGEEEDQLEYKTQHRFEDEPQVERISGDFTALNLMPIVTARISKATIESYHSEKEGEEEGEPSVFEEEVPEVLDRAPYYELHEKLTQEHITHKIKNNFLHRKMAEYFKKRKMEHVLKETEQQVDTQQKYGKRLDALAELMEIDERKRTIINAEINELTATRDEKLESITVAFKQMQDREKEISTGLINTKTGKELPQKLIERLLRRQSITAQQVADLRLKYIKIRDRVNEKQAKLQDLDKLGDNLRIIDYEQLKVENRSHADKIEERDEELTRLRRKCESSSQILAHMREKSASATLDLIENTKRLEEVEIECMEARERANFFKQQRDYYRMLTNKLIQDSGLLTHPKLLQDMEEAIADVENNSAKLKELQMTYEIQTQKIRAIRKNIEIAPFRMQLRKKSGDKKDKDAPTYYKRRPTLMVPKLPVQFLYYHKSRRINPFKKK